MKKIVKKWWFWLLIILGIIIIACVLIVVLNRNNRYENSKHDLAYKVQHLNDNSTVYVSAGEHSIVVQSFYKSGGNFSEMFELVSGQLYNLKKYDYLVLQIYTDYYLFETKFDISTTKILEENVYKVTSVEEEQKELTSSASLKGEDKVIGAGTYAVGGDIKPGKYDVILKSGSGNFWVEGTMVNEIFNDDMKTYSNLTLENGDNVNLRGNLQILLQAK